MWREDKGSEMNLREREWVGLSDEEKQWFKGLGLAGVEFIEAKLREKNL